MSEVKSRIQDAVKAAMKAGERERLATLRMVSAAIKQREVDTREAVTDDDVIDALSRMVKQRREALEQYEQAGREDLAAKERAEMAIIAEFLPAALDEAELDGLIDAAIAETGAESIRDMGKVMARLKPQVQGRADMSAVSGRVKQRLAG